MAEKKPDPIAEALAKIEMILRLPYSDNPDVAKAKRLLINAVIKDLA